jgi:hypothetical protein
MPNFKFQIKNKNESNAFFVPEFKSSFQEKNLKRISQPNMKKSKKFNLLETQIKKSVKIWLRWLRFKQNFEPNIYL